MPLTKYESVVTHKTVTVLKADVLGALAVPVSPRTLVQWELRDGDLLVSLITPGEEATFTYTEAVVLERLHLLVPDTTDVAVKLTAHALVVHLATVASNSYEL